MYLFVFLLVLSFGSVQIYCLPLHLEECKKICSERFFNLSTKFNNNCQSGCQYFHGVDYPMEKDSNAILRECHLACNNNFNDNEGNKPCIIGCNAVYITKQHEFKSVTSSAEFKIDSKNGEHGKEDFAKIHENRAVIAQTVATAKATEADHRREYYEEYSILQYSSVIQLTIFCIVLVGIVACSVKIIVLVYQLQFAAMKYMMETSAENELLQVVTTNKSAKRYYNDGRIKSQII